jgi:hypothetical protein
MTVSPRRVDGPPGLNELAIAGVRYLLVGVSSSHLAGLVKAANPGVVLSRSGVRHGTLGSLIRSRCTRRDDLESSYALWPWVDRDGTGGRDTVRPWRYERSRTEL